MSKAKVGRFKYEIEDDDQCEERVSDRGNAADELEHDYWNWLKTKKPALRRVAGVGARSRGTPREALSLVEKMELVNLTVEEALGLTIPHAFSCKLKRNRDGSFLSTWSLVHGSQALSLGEFEGDETFFLRHFLRVHQSIFMSQLERQGLSARKINQAYATVDRKIDQGLL